MKHALYDQYINIVLACEQYYMTANYVLMTSRLVL